MGEIDGQLEDRSVRATETCIENKFKVKQFAVKPLSAAQYEVAVAVPYRLDLTVSALRRLSTNIVDILAAEGHYIRALGGGRAPVVARVTQEQPDALTVTFKGREGVHIDHTPALATVQRMLGTDRALALRSRQRHFVAEAFGGPDARREAASGYPYPVGSLRQRGRVSTK